MSTEPPLIEVDRLTLAFGAGDAARRVVADVSFSLRAGEAAALVGESGSGKTLIAKAIVGLLPRGARIEAGAVKLDGAVLDDKGWAAARGRAFSFIFQEPLSSLNPALRIEAQLTEAPSPLAREERRVHALDMLKRVYIRDPETVLRRYPHELSGGMRQRVMIASALLSKPKLVIADEPTTALDMIVQQEILTLIKELCAEENAAILMITHDLSVVADVAQSALVIEKGRIVEAGPAAELIGRPKHPYTRALLEAIPRPAAESAPPAQAKTLLLEAHDVHVAITERGLLKQGAAKAIVTGVSLGVAKGETLALIGESGSGKTTLGRVLAGLAAPSAGEVRFNGDAEQARQFIFQDPFAALNPAHRIGDIIGEGLLKGRALSRPAREARVAEAMAAVDLDPAMARRFPHQLSGGQRQRVNIARAIVLRPSLIVADEPLAALDLSVQKRIVDLLERLKRDMGFACVLISHDLGIIEQMADNVAVLYCGVVVELGPRARVFGAPAHPYTRKLLSATPYLKAEGDGAYALTRRAPPAAPLAHKPYEPDPRSSSHLPFRHIETGPGHFVACRA